VIWRYNKLNVLLLLLILLPVRNSLH